jgi:DtxR family transcriptional regulator, Mn-dependent transcriptional regulator
MSERLTGSLEDYLETVYELVREQKVARVRDIARTRGVRAASVTPAMRRLAEIGMIRYVQREFIDLTAKGEDAARRIFARHQILTRFFQQVLEMPAGAAQANACAMEHSLSPEGMDHLVRFFEFLGNCPRGGEFLEQFHSCSRVRHESGTCSRACPYGATQAHRPRSRRTTVAVLPPGVRARVTKIEAGGPLRDRLLDMGLLPDVLVEVKHAARDRLVLRVQGFEIGLSHKEAAAVLVARTDAP